jgi:glucose-6-phosphate dehydrogenase assembly protein OpcA
MVLNGQITNAPSFDGVDISKIEKQLAVMWHESNPPESAGAGSDYAVSRACALNLIIYTSAREDSSPIYQLLDEVSAQHPGRTFLIIADRDVKLPSMDSDAGLICRKLGGGNKAVCNEQITFRADGPALSSAASAIAPLLVPDVPVFLWWKDPPNYNDDLWTDLALMSDRIVVDSEHFSDIVDDFTSLKQLVLKKEADIRVTDLNWGRLTTWRSLIAGFWDIPAYRTDLESIEYASIGYNPDSNVRNGSSAKPLLLAGWLASRLGWRFEKTDASADQTYFTFDHLNRKITIMIAPSKSGPQCKGLITSLSFTARGGSAEFAVRLSDDARRLTTEARIDGQMTAGRTLSYEARSEGQRLSSELSFLNRDAVYENSLAVAAELATSAIGLWTGGLDHSGTDRIS